MSLPRLSDVKSQHFARLSSNLCTMQRRITHWPCRSQRNFGRFTPSSFLHSWINGPANQLAKADKQLCAVRQGSLGWIYWTIKLRLRHHHSLSFEVDGKLQGSILRCRCHCLMKGWVSKSLNQTKSSLLMSDNQIVESKLNYLSVKLNLTPSQYCS